MFQIADPTPIRDLPQLSINESGIPSPRWRHLAYGVIATMFVNRIMKTGYPNLKSEWWTSTGYKQMFVGYIEFGWENKALQQYRANARKFAYCVGLSENRNRGGAKQYPHVFSGVRFTDGTGFIISEFAFERPLVIKCDRHMQQPIDAVIHKAIASFDDANILLAYLRGAKISRAVGCQIIVEVFTQKDIRAEYLKAALMAWDAVAEGHMTLDTLYRACASVQARCSPWNQAAVLRKLRHLCDGYSGGGHI